MRQTFAAAALLFFPGQKLFAQRGREFFARQQFDFVLHARIVGNHHAAARGVAEQSHDRGMRAANDAHNAAFGAARARQAAEPRNFGDHRVAVHGVFNVIARNENVAVHVRQSYIRHHEAVAILVKDQAALDFVAGACFVLREVFGSRRRSALGGCPAARAVCETAGRGNARG